jgi:hypothetical protein
MVRGAVAPYDASELTLAPANDHAALHRAFDAVLGYCDTGGHDKPHPKTEHCVEWEPVEKMRQAGKLGKKPAKDRASPHRALDAVLDGPARRMTGDASKAQILYAENDLGYRQKVLAKARELGFSAASLQGTIITLEGFNGTPAQRQTARKILNNFFYLRPY